MAKYVALQNEGDHLGWFVAEANDQVCLCPPPLIEAEAHIIAWALNAVADGRTITALIPPEDCLHGIRYAGPIAGVAPHD